MTANFFFRIKNVSESEIYQNQYLAKSQLLFGEEHPLSGSHRYSDKETQHHACIRKTVVPVRLWVLTYDCKITMDTPPPPPHTHTHKQARAVGGGGGGLLYFFLPLKKKGELIPQIYGLGVYPNSLTSKREKNKKK